LNVPSAESASFASAICSILRLDLSEQTQVHALDHARFKLSEVEALILWRVLLQLGSELARRMTVARAGLLLQGRDDLAYADRASPAPDVFRA
jgi:hypothetical protein